MTTLATVYNTVMYLITAQRYHHSLHYCDMHHANDNLSVFNGYWFHHMTDN